MMRCLFLSLCLLYGCAYGQKGEACVSSGNTGKQCGPDLVCCAVDARKSDQGGVCVEEKGLAQLGDACGVTTNRCCGLGLSCEASVSTGDGTCVKSR